MNTHGTLPDSFAGHLIRHLDDGFAPDTGCALILLLCALSSRTGNPVSARTAGNGSAHTRVALAIEALMGDWAVYVTSATEAGIVSLGEKDQPRTILYEGRLSEPLHDALGRLIQGKPLRCLDAPMGDRKRLREFNDPAAVLLFDCDYPLGPEVLTKLVSVRVNDRETSSRQDADRRTVKFTARAKAARREAGEWEAALRKRLRSIRWDRLVVFDGVAKMAAQVTTRGDVDRLEQLLSLTSVWVLLVEQPQDPGDAIVATARDVQTVVEILDGTAVDDERRHLSVPAAGFLKGVQSHERATPPNAAEAATVEAKSQIAAQPERYVRFTLYDLKAYKPFAALSADRIDALLRQLEAGGMVEKDGRDGHRRAWRLTPWGREYHRRPLADLLRRLTDNANSGQVEPTPPGVAAEAQPTPTAV